MAGRIREPGPTSTRTAENLRRLRQERGLSYAELARRLQAIGHPILDTGLLKIEKGDRRIDVDDLIALAIALETSPNRLLLPEMDVEHAADNYQLTSSVSGTPPLLWSWATGEVPLGHLPSKVADDRTTRGEEVVFNRLNRPQHWHDWGDAGRRLSPGAWTQELAFARTAVMTYLIVAFRAGMSTAEIRSVAEAAFAAILVTTDPAGLTFDIEATELGITIHLDDSEGVGVSLGLNATDPPSPTEGDA